MLEADDAGLRVTLEQIKRCAEGSPPEGIEYSEAITLLAQEVLRLSGVAQSVERRPVKPVVAGSSPAPGANSEDGACLLCERTRSATARVIAEFERELNFWREESMARGANVAAWMPIKKHESDNGADG